MAGSFNQLKYDAGTYATDLKQSTAPLTWQLDPNFANTCKPCFAQDVGYIGRQGVSLSKDRSLIDVDSNMKLLNFRNSRNPAMKYAPTCQLSQSGGSCSLPGYQRGGGVGLPGYPNGGGIAPNTCQQPQINSCQEDKFNYSNCGLYTDYSRLTNPSCTLRGTGWNRFQPMCLNFQDENRWLHPGEVGINYRMVAKDNHRPKIPVPMNQMAALPDPNAPAPDTCPKVGDCCGVFTGAMNPYYVNLLTTPYKGMDC